ncbi:hypothetical protein AGMMS50233_09980 [Endomicrobiia bacterium]|nr:hypothetical protein AGMMS50233_09980 [Endomicrobiia bacterium]
MELELKAPIDDSSDKDKDEDKLKDEDNLKQRKDKLKQRKDKLEAEITRLKEKQKDLEGKCSVASNKVIELKGQINEQNAQLNRLAGEGRSVTSKKDDNARKLQESERELADKKYDNARKLQESERELTNKKNEIKRKAEEMDNDLSKTKKDKERAQAKHKECECILLDCHNKVVGGVSEVLSNQNVTTSNQEAQKLLGMLEKDVADAQEIDREEQGRLAEEKAMLAIELKSDPIRYNMNKEKADKDMAGAHEKATVANKHKEATGQEVVDKQKAAAKARKETEETLNRIILEMREESAKEADDAVDTAKAKDKAADKTKLAADIEFTKTAKNAEDANAKAGNVHARLARYNNRAPIDDLNLRLGYLDSSSSADDLSSQDSDSSLNSEKPYKLNPGENFLDMVARVNKATDNKNKTNINAAQGRLLETTIDGRQMQDLLSPDQWSIAYTNADTLRLKKLYDRTEEYSARQDNERVKAAEDKYAEAAKKEHNAARLVEAIIMGQNKAKDEYKATMKLIKSVNISKDSSSEDSDSNSNSSSGDSGSNSSSGDSDSNSSSSSDDSDSNSNSGDSDSNTSSYGKPSLKSTKVKAKDLKFELEILDLLEKLGSCNKKLLATDTEKARVKVEEARKKSATNEENRNKILELVKAENAKQKTEAVAKVTCQLTSTEKNLKGMQKENAELKQREARAQEETRKAQERSHLASISTRLVFCFANAVNANREKAQEETRKAQEETRKAKSKEEQEKKIAELAQVIASNVNKKSKLAYQSQKLMTGCTNTLVAALNESEEKNRKFNGRADNMENGLEEFATSQDGILIKVPQGIAQAQEGTVIVVEKKTDHAQKEIARLYEENRELQRKLAGKKAPTGGCGADGRGAQGKGKQEEKEKEDPTDKYSAASADESGAQAKEKRINELNKLLEDQIKVRKEAEEEARKAEEKARNAEAKAEKGEAEKADAVKDICNQVQAWLDSNNAPSELSKEFNKKFIEQPQQQSSEGTDEEIYQ